ncbi:PAS domain S-box protein [uncultured Abyssibacter sp.]|uniref:PAS domain S-box protein n=1 Tax=uncultured Abyssibacter sp. TaxID=2320202 RepID=UPI0032B2A8F6
MADDLRSVRKSGASARDALHSSAAAANEGVAPRSLLWVETLPDAFLVWRADTRAIVQVNARLVALMSRPREDLLGLSVSRLFADARSDAVLGTSPALGGQWHARLHMGNGMHLDVEISASKLDADAHVCWSVREVGHWLSREHLLRDELERQRAHLLNSGDGFVTLDRAMKAVDVSPSFARMLGYTVNEMMGMFVWDWDVVYSQEECLAIARSDRFGRTPLFETRCRCKDGSLIDVEIRINALEWGGEDLAFCVVRDVTERNDAQRKLHEQERYLQAALDNFPFLVWLKDTEGRYLAVNRAFVSAAGACSPQELIGKNDQDYWPTLAERYRRDDLTTLRTLKPMSMVEPFEDGGEDRWVETHKLPLKLDGEIAGVMGYARDITDERQAAQVIRAHKHEREALFDQFPDPTVVFDRDNRVTAWNRAMTALTGVSAQEMLGQNPQACASVIHGGARPMAVSVLENQDLPHDYDLLERSSEQVMMACSDQRASTRHFSVVAGRLRGENGDPIGMVEQLRDVSELYETRNRILQLSLAVQQTSQSVIITDLNGVVDYVNDAFVARSGYPRNRIVGENISIINSPDTPEIIFSELNTRLDQGLSWKGEFTSRTADGDSIIEYAHISPVKQADGRITHYLRIQEDVTQRRRDEKALERREREFRTLVESSPDFIARYDRQLKLRYANPALLNSVGATLSELAQDEVRAQMNLDADAFTSELRAVFQSGRESEIEVRYRTRDQAIRWCSVRIAPEVDSDNVLTGVIAIGRDVTSDVNRREEVHRLAYYDNVTGTPNRTLIREHVAALLESSDPPAFALLMIDLDHFKDVNDSLGHVAGDRLLRDAAGRLMKLATNECMIGRLGGDEFAVLVQNAVDTNTTEALAERMLAELARPFEIDGRQVFISASIGIASSPTDSQQLDELFAFADQAMYVAKAIGRNRCQFFRQEMSDSANERMELSSELHQAIQRDELELWFQPKIRLSDRHLIGAEALLRWRHPVRGLIGPDRFIPLAEETGSAVAIGEWVLRKACQQAVRSNARLPANPVRIAVNCSIRQFQMGRLEDRVAAILDETGCKGEWLEIEITEGLLLENSKSVRRTLKTLNQLGLTIAIDDFGTGHASLGYLNQFNVDVLKIDRSFVTGVTESEQMREVIKAILSVAQALKLNVVAEGVETEDQASLLESLGCDAFQGWLCGRAVQAAEFESRIIRSSSAGLRYLPDEPQ